MKVYDSSYSIIFVNTGGLRTQDRLELAKYNQLQIDRKGQIILAPGMVHRYGIMLLSKNPAPEIELLRSDPKGKYLIFTITSTNDTVVAIYVPSGILN